jgi:hypothetical protein
MDEIESALSPELRASESSSSLRALLGQSRAPPSSRRHFTLPPRFVLHG